MGDFCILVKLHREGSAPAAGAAGLYYEYLNACWMMAMGLGLVGSSHLPPEDGVGELFCITGGQGFGKFGFCQS